MTLDLGHKRIGDGSAAEYKAVLGRYIFTIRLEQQIIGKAQFNGFVGIHPGLGIHKVAELGTGQPGLDFIGIDNAFLNFGEHSDCLLHLLTVTDGNCQRIMDHHQCRGRHENLGTCHGNDGCGRSGNAVDFHSHIALVVHEHIVDLCRCHAVAAGRVDPHGNVAAAAVQFILEKLRRYIIVKPAFFGDGPVQKQRPLLNLFLRLLIGHRLGLPIPEFLHRIFPPFRHWWVYLQKLRHFSAGAYCR